MGIDHIQCGAVITRSIFSKVSQKIPNSSLVRAWYGVSFVDPASDWSCNHLCNILLYWTAFNGNRLYIACLYCVLWRSLLGEQYISYQISLIILRKHAATRGLTVLCEVHGMVLEVHLYGMSLATLRWRHNGLDDVSNHQPLDCLRNHLFGRSSKKTTKLRVTGLCVGNSPGNRWIPRANGQ